MAGIYDVNAAIDKPNVLASFRQGEQYGNALRQQQQAQQDNAALRGLAPQIIAGDPNAYGQAAAIDPAAAKQYQGAGDDQLRRLKGAIDFIDKARQSGNEQQAEAAYRQVIPYLAKNGNGQQPPATLAEALPKMEEARARIAMLDGAGTQGRVQSTYVDDQGQRVAIMADGTQKVLGGNDSGMSQQTISIPGSDGLPRQYTFDKRTGNYVPAGSGGDSSALGTTPAPGTQRNPLPQDATQPVIDQIMASANQLIAQGVPEGQVDAWVQQQMQGGGQPQQAQPMPQQPQGGGLPPRLDYQNGGNVNPFVGRSPEDQAAATEAAKLRAQLQYLPSELQMRTQADLQKAEGTGEITRQNEAATAVATRGRDANKTLTLLGEAEALLPGATGSRAGAIADDAAAFFGTSTPGAQKTAQLKTIAGQLTSSMPRMQGPQSDKDVQLYKEMAGDLANDNLPVETRMSALKTIRSLNEKYAGAQQAPASGGGTVQRATNPQTGQVIELRNGQWVPAQ